MPKLKIGDTEYHLAFRTIIRCQLRTIDAKHAVVAEGEAVCNLWLTDEFGERIRLLGHVAYLAKDTENAIERAALAWWREWKPAKSK